jgi:four helix bundle protein
LSQEQAERGFEDLECYQLALRVRKQAYGLARRLPDGERYNLASQVRRCAASVTLNIAEGYGRYHYLESLRSYYITRGSLMETLSVFVSSEAVGYLQPDELSALRQLTHSALRSLNGYIRYVRKQKQGSQEYGERTLREESPTYIVVSELSVDDE